MTAPIINHYLSERENEGLQLGVDHQQAPRGLSTFSELLTYSPARTRSRTFVVFFWSPGQVSTIPAQLSFDLI
jgi:hypothetical protein